MMRHRPKSPPTFASPKKGPQVAPIPINLHPLFGPNGRLIGKVDPYSGRLYTVQGTQSMVYDNNGRENKAHKTRRGVARVMGFDRSLSVVEEEEAQHRAAEALK